MYCVATYLNNKGEKALKAVEGSEIVRCIWFKPGYVESSKVSWLIYEADGSKFNREEAMFSLAEELYNKYLQEHRPYKRKCCYEAPAIAKYCPDCGQVLMFEFKPDHFLNWLCSLSELDCDGYGGEDNDIWSPYCTPQQILGIPKLQHIFLSHYGDLAILYALHLNPRVAWQGDFDIGKGCWSREYLERHWGILMKTGEWSLG